MRTERILLVSMALMSAPCFSQEIRSPNGTYVIGNFKELGRIAGARSSILNGIVLVKELPELKKWQDQRVRLAVWNPTSRGVAVHWVQTFPEGEVRDSALSVALDHITQVYPQEALELSSWITDEELRKEKAAVAREFVEARSSGQ